MLWKRSHQVHPCYDVRMNTSPIRHLFIVNLWLHSAVCVWESVFFQLSNSNPRISSSSNFFKKPIKKKSVPPADCTQMWFVSCALYANTFMVESIPSKISGSILNGISEDETSVRSEVHWWWRWPSDHHGVLKFICHLVVSEDLPLADCVWISIN